MDPLDLWLGNQEVVEHLAQFLTDREIGLLCRVSHRWREALNIDHVWYKLCKTARCHTEFGKIGGRHEAETGELQALCEWGYHYRLCRGVRRRWREGGEDVRVMEVPEKGKSGVVSCFDCEDDILAVGTITGCLICWDMSSNTSRAVECVLDSKVDKLYVRHSKVVLMQGGLIQVYQVLDKSTLVFCKTLDSPNKRKLYGAGVTYDDDSFVPPIPREQLAPRYKPETPVSFPQLDITVSTQGRERLGISLTGSSEAKIYKLETGEFEQKIQLENGDTLLKLGIVQFEEFSDFLYIVLNDICLNICGVMFDLNSKQLLWRLELHTVFNYNFSVFSLFTRRGLLLFGRKPNDSYPFTWLWKGYTYLGLPYYTHEYETEYDMYLADCSESAVVTPRAMTYLYPGTSVLAFSQRTHRGVSTMAYTWGTDGNTNKLWKANCQSETSTLKTDCNVPVCGSDVGSVVLTCQGPHKLVLRDLRSGAKLREVMVEGRVGNMWADEEKIVTIDRELRNQGSVTVIRMGWRL